MMTGITIAKETRLFLLSLAVGAGMSFLYDLLRVLRRRTAQLLFRWRTFCISCCVLCCTLPLF